MLKLTILATFLACAFATPQMLRIGDGHILCDNCKKLIDKFITEEYLQQLLTEGAKSCDSLPTALSAKCKDLVTQYGAQVAAEMLREKDQLCIMAQMCKPTSPSQSRSFSLWKNPLKQVADPTGIQCSVCKTGTNTIGYALGTTLFTTDLLNLCIKTACTDPTNTMCTLAVNTIYTQMTSNLKMDLSCNLICRLVVAGCTC